MAARFQPQLGSDSFGPYAIKPPASAKEIWPRALEHLDHALQGGVADADRAALQYRLGFAMYQQNNNVPRALELMSAHGMTRPTSFRGGGLFANAANLRAIAAAGFSVDASATSAGVFGRLPFPWTLAKDAQPYHPAPTDANAAGTLPLLEVPNIAGNTYGNTIFSIQTTIRDDLAMLAPPSQAATGTRVLTLVSHPATIDATERGAIESLFSAFAPLRYDTDSGPLRFITLAQVAAALK